MAKKRRGHVQGSIFQRKDGRWCAVITLGYKDGKLQRKNYYGATQKEVSDKLDEGRGNLKKGIAPEIGKKLTLGAYLEYLVDGSSETYPPARYVQSLRATRETSPLTGARAYRIDEADARRHRTLHEQAGV